MDHRQYIAEIGSGNGGQLLEAWRWLIGPRLELGMVTKAGDAVLVDPSDGSVHFLDTMNGKVERVAGSKEEFEALMAGADEERAGEWFMPHVVDGCAARGIGPSGPGRCLSQKHPGALGGSLEPDNWRDCDLDVHFRVMGQIHVQIKDLPPGTEIRVLPPQDARGGDGDCGVGAATTVREPSENVRPRAWWKFW